ncbi:putative membrane protein [Bacillus thermotolerans]|uniref:Membrane protein n=1 Tax=Bacillus thermotolerans TaxID=1221996 RepID=A0A0F5HNT9_BACTR|nr:putative membrane protein [Bacillus thermotolerans]KKB40595.1 putative membrane protein [Bacillus thermotolerans]KKB41931.1 putative membrane protein [Bacillus thermotolerans]
MFSLSFALFTQGLAVSLFKQVGLYTGLLEMFTETELKLAMTIALMMLFFFIISGLKVIANTLNELSLLFFSKDTEGELLRVVRSGSIIFFLGGLLSLISFSSIKGILIIFALTAIGYFVYFVYKTSKNLSPANLIGLIAFQIVSWSTLVVLLALVGMKLYNGVLGGLPL